MSRQQRKFTAEFKQEAVALVRRSGQSGQSGDEGVGRHVEALMRCRTLLDAPGQTGDSEAP